MTNIIRKTILVSIAAAAMAVSLQPAQAGGFPGPGIIKPGIGKPWKPGGFKKPHHHKHHKHHYGEAAALGLLGGMIIGGALANSQGGTVYVNQGDGHVAWCLNRYRSYHIPSDTYMSNSGYRKYCNSPYN